MKLRPLPAFALALALAGAVELFALHLLQPLENRLLDAFVRAQAEQLTPDPDIVLVDIDEKSLNGMKDDAGSWPWPRSVYGTLIEGLEAQKPRAIVFDIMFTEPDRFRPEHDAVFSEAAAKHPNTYFAFLRLPRSSDRIGIRIADYAEQLGIAKTDFADPEAKVALVPPLVLPKEVHRRAGLITYVEDADGVGRRYLLRETVGGWRIPSLPARVAADLGYSMPDQDDVVLAWRGSARSFPKVSFVDLYEDFNRSQHKRPPQEFAGKILIVGTAATGLQDLRVTPIDNLHPGAEILGTAIENLKNSRQMRYAPAAAPALIGLALLALVFVAFRRGVDARFTGGALALASGGLLFASHAAAGRLLLLPVLTPLITAWTFYLVAALADYLRERREKQAAMAQFSRFTNPHVARQLVERGGIETGRREVTLLFSDIRGFTTLSETRSPEEVIDLLNRYFSLQVEVVFRHGGSLDKFIGDCIMAIWGAPLDDPRHAQNAVACALDMADTLQAFKRELGEGAGDFDVGIGIHSGPAVVGLMGSQRRLEYTAIGDTVNLASRVEGLTKDAKCRILVSRETKELCGEEFDFVFSGSYKVKGRVQEVELFEPRRKK